MRSPGSAELELGKGLALVGPAFCELPVYVRLKRPSSGRRLPAAPLASCVCARVCRPRIKKWTKILKWKDTAHKNGFRRLDFLVSPPSTGGPLTHQAPATARRLFDSALLITWGGNFPTMPI